MVQKLIGAIVLCVAVVMPPPGTSAAASSPSGATILARMTAAMKKAPSYHIHMVMSVSEQPVTQTILLDADISQQPTRVHELLIARTSSSSKRTPAIKTSSEVVIVGKKSSVRVNAGRWRCTALTSLTGLTSQFVNLSSMQRRNAHVLGTGVLGGVRVWKLAVNIGVWTGAGKMHMPTTYEVAQTDYTLRAASANATLSMAKQKAHERLQATYTNYGKPVHVSIPAVCAK